MPERDSSHSSHQDVAGEDFLFHLYRGSELLQDNRVHDAKVELEQALALQPTDPKGQDLLGIVYFRLGLYPRAITIYERLVQTHPDAIEPRINLALSYLKTGQPARAGVELERVVAQSPTHGRAWGYLGLAMQRIGDYERAAQAFLSGGHEAMARRVAEMAPNGVPVSIRSEMLGARASQRPSPQGAFQEIDRADVGLPPNAEMPPRSPSGGWVTSQIPPPPPPSKAAPAGEPPRKASEVARSHLLIFPRDMPVSLHPSGAVLIQASNGFATRLHLIRSITSAAEAAGAVLQRRSRGRVLDEPLGGSLAPLVEIGGRSEIVLATGPGQRLLPLSPGEEPLYLREDILAAFDTSISYENGRLPSGDGDAIPMVQLRGGGTLVASVPQSMTALEVVQDRRTLVRGANVLGWLGRLVPRALLQSESPAGVRGFVAFAGEGMVLVDGR